MPRSRLRRYFRHGFFPQMVAFEACVRLGSVTRAAEELSLAQPTVSHHLKVLTEAGLLERERRGSWAWYRLVPARLAEVQAGIQEIAEAFIKGGPA